MAESLVDVDTMAESLVDVDTMAESLVDVVMMAESLVDAVTMAESSRSSRLASGTLGPCDCSRPSAYPPIRRWRPS